MLPILLATVTSSVVGFVQVSPGLCQIEYIQDRNEIVTVTAQCSTDS